MNKKEDSIEILKAYRDKLSNSASNQLDKDIKAFNAAIKALEQEPKTDVLDKIRAEIDEQYKWLINTRYTICDIDIAFGSIFRFIDKYKAESEEE